MEFENDIIKELSHRPFFSRFSHEQLKPFLLMMSVHQAPPNSLIFVDDCAIIILSGVVFTRNHHATFKTMAKHVKGSVLGLPEID